MAVSKVVPDEPLLNPERSPCLRVIKSRLYSTLGPVCYEQSDAQQMVVTSRYSLQQNFITMLPPAFEG